jgi:hypothetical protein
VSKQMIIKVTEAGALPLLSEVPKLDLRTMQSLVGGLIQPVQLEPGITLWCDEEAKLKGIPLNRHVEDVWGNVWDINGPFFLCGDNEEGDAFGLTVVQATKWLALLQ